jgi:hypothetical protein
LTDTRIEITPKATRRVRCAGTAPAVGIVIEYRRCHDPSPELDSRRDGRWRIFDIVLGPVSVIDLYRAQFDRIIRAYSYQELLRRMTNRLARL